MRLESSRPPRELPVRSRTECGDGSCARNATLGGTFTREASSIETRRHWGIRTVAGVALLCAAVLGAVAVGAADAATVTATPELVSIRDGGLVYEFHALTGTESLWDASQPATARRNLIRERAGDAGRLRARLEAELSDPGFATLRAGRADAIERLRKLGYL